MPTETGPKSRLRDELIRRAKLGEITPSDAESEAMLFDCGPLEVRPETLDLDPQTEDQWTLLMALVWIIERDPAAVRAVWNRARRDATEWVGPLAESGGTGAANKKSWELKPLDPPTVADVDAVVDEDARFMLPPFIVPGLKAREDLWAHLRSGRLPAHGKRCGATERTEMSTADWTSLDWLADRSASADTVGDRMENAPRYGEVSVSWQRVREIWPPLEEVPSEEFEREDWTAEHATLWIAYRNPALFHFVAKLRGPRAQVQFSSTERHESSPKKTLLSALKTDKLKAIRNGQEIQPENWFGQDLPRRQPEAKSIYFRRSDVMREWPALTEDLRRRIGRLLSQLWCERHKRPSQKDAYDFLKKREDCKEVTISFVRQWMNDNWGPGTQGKRRLDPDSRPPETPH